MTQNLRKSTYKEEEFILAHGSEDPVSGCLMCCVGACGGSM
jgi:hypothetical protein